MTDARETTEIVYTHPTAGRVKYGAWAMAAVVSAVVLWPSYKVLGRVGSVITLAVILGGAIALRRLSNGRTLVALNVSIDPHTKRLRIEHRMGMLELDGATITAVRFATLQTAEGLSLDVVILDRGESPAVRFSVSSAGAAEGAARAITTVLGLGLVTSPTE